MQAAHVNAPMPGDGCQERRRMRRMFFFRGGGGAPVSRRVYVCVLGNKKDCAVDFLRADECTDIASSVFVWKRNCRLKARVTEGRYMDDIHTAPSGHS